MDNLNYLFFDEYKRLDKLCGDLYETPYVSVIISMI